MSTELFNKKTKVHLDFHLSNSKPEHTTGGSLRGARRGGGAESIKLFAYRILRLGNNPSSHSPKHRETSPERFLRSTNKRNPTCRIQNSDIPRAGRVGAPGGAAGRGRARLRASIIIRPENKIPPFPPSHLINVSSTSSQNNEQAKSYVNRWKNTTTG